MYLLEPSRRLLVQSQQWKQQNNVCNLFNGNNKHIKNDISNVLNRIVNFEQTSHIVIFLLLTLNKLMQDKKLKICTSSNRVLAHS